MIGRKATAGQRRNDVVPTSQMAATCGTFIYSSLNTVVRRAFTAS